MPPQVYTGATPSVSYIRTAVQPSVCSSHQTISTQNSPIFWSSHNQCPCRCLRLEEQVLWSHTPTPEIHIENTYIHRMILFFEGTGNWPGVFFVLASVRDSRSWNFSIKSLRSSAFFGGRLQHPSPCLIRSAPRRIRG